MEYLNYTQLANDFYHISILPVKDLIPEEKLIGYLPTHQFKHLSDACEATCVHYNPIRMPYSQKMKAIGIFYIHTQDKVFEGVTSIVTIMKLHTYLGR